MSLRRQSPLLLSIALAAIFQVPLAHADESPSLTLRNDITAPIDLYIASEKSQSDSPWHHFTLEAGQSTNVNMVAPDRYFVVLQIGDQRSKSKPLDLRKFTTEHPNYVMLISEIQDTTLGAPMGGGGGGGEGEAPNINHIAASIGAGDSAKASATTPNDTLRVQFDRFAANDQNIWMLSPDNVTLKLHNDLNDAVDFYIASKKNESPNPWTHLSIEPNADTSIILKSPDPFLIRVQMGDESARSKPIELKAFLAKHGDYVMNVGRDYENMIAGGPMGGGNHQEQEPKLTVHVESNTTSSNSPEDHLPIEWQK